MGETLQPVIAGFNRSLRIERRADRLTGDPGAVLLREVLERSGIVSWMMSRLDARLRAGNVGTAEGALDVILDVVDRARRSFCDVAMVRIDAGFPSAALMAGLEARGILIRPLPVPTAATANRENLYSSLHGETPS